MKKILVRAGKEKKEKNVNQQLCLLVVVRGVNIFSTKGFEFQRLMLLCALHFQPLAVRFLEMILLIKHISSV